MLILSYDDLKPPSVTVHTALEAWVRAGGVLVYVGDPQPRAFDEISSWWREQAFAKPIHHLLERLGIKASSTMQRIERGAFIWLETPAAKIARDPIETDRYLACIRESHEASRTRDGAWRTANALVMRRGPYVVMAGLALGSSQLEGRFIDLLGEDLPLLECASVGSHQHRLLYDLERRPPNRRAIITAGRIELEEDRGDSLHVTVSAPEGIRGQLILALGTQPQRVTLQQEDCQLIWDNASKIARVWFDGQPAGLEFRFQWGNHL